MINQDLDNLLIKRGDVLNGRYKLMEQIGPAADQIETAAVYYLVKDCQENDRL
jgi:hypothetical protein